MKVAVVTGASSGIGEGVIKSLLNDDWKVYGVSRSKPNLDGEGFFWLKCDLSKSLEIRDAFARISEPAVDLLISNAGVAFEEPATEVTVESFNRMYTVNVLAPMIIVASLKQKLFKSTIISISSVSDRFVEKDFVLYGSSKAANTRYFDTLASELPDARVYALLPDYVDTPMLRKSQEGTDFDWSKTLTVQDLVALMMDLESGKHIVDSGSNIIVVNERMKEDLLPTEKLFGYNADTGELSQL